MTEPQRQDWAQLIRELNEAGITSYKLSQMLGLQLIQVQRIIAGSEPGHHLGERIRVIHAEYVPHETLHGVTVPITQRS